MGRLRLFDKIAGAVVLICLAFGAQAQDPVFSQFHLNKNYLNPAYAGYTQDLSIGVNSRMQWMATPGVFSTNTFNANIGCAPSKLGLALTGYSHREGEGFLHSQSVALQSSVNFGGKWDTRAWKSLRGKKFIFSGGLSLGVGQKRLDWSKLTFTDQYSVYSGFTDNPTAVTPQNEASNMIFDLGAGVKMQTGYGNRGGYLSFGAAMNHLNRPVESFFGHENVLQPRYTFHGFWYFQPHKFIKTKKPGYLSLGVVVDWQDPLLTSTYLAYKDIGDKAKVGMGFRSRSFMEVDQNTDALIFQGMVALGDVTISYSYDLTVSSLGPQRTFGSHEVGLIFLFKNAAICPTKSVDNCFYLMSDISPDMRDLYLWNP